MVSVKLGNKKKQFRSIEEAAKAYGVPYMTVYMRMRMGMSAVKALTTPVRSYKKKVA